MTQPSDLPRLRLPAPPDLNVRAGAGNAEVYDPLRERFVVLTPEEWVRQHMIHFMFSVVGVPRGLLSSERGVKHGRGRTDLVAYTRDGAAWMIIECKAATIAVDQTTVDQVAGYNRSMHAPYLAVTNGLTVHAWDCTVDPPRVLESMPTYPTGSQAKP